MAIVQDAEYTGSFCVEIFFILNIFRLVFFVCLFFHCVVQAFFSLWHKECLHTSERHLLFFCFQWLFLIVSASLLWKHNWWVMKRMLPRTRLNETFYRLVVKPQAALPAESWSFAVEGGRQLGFLGLRAVHWLIQGCTVCQVLEQNLDTWVLFGCSPLNQGLLLCEGCLCSCLCCRSPAWACQFKPEFWSVIHFVNHDDCAWSALLYH